MLGINETIDWLCRDRGFPERSKRLSGFVKYLLEEHCKSIYGGMQ